MEQELAELKRIRDTNPADAEASQRYEVSLLRVGRREDVEKLYTFKFHCEFPWYRMDETEEANTRNCSKCSKAVHFVETREEMAERIRQGACVAFNPRDVDALGFLINEPTVTSADGLEKTCLVECTNTDVDHPVGEAIAIDAVRVGQTVGVDLIRPPTAGVPVRVDPGPVEPESEKKPGFFARLFGGLFGENE